MAFAIWSHFIRSFKMLSCWITSNISCISQCNKLHVFHFCNAVDSLAIIYIKPQGSSVCADECSDNYLLWGCQLDGHEYNYWHSLQFSKRKFVMIMDAISRTNSLKQCNVPRGHKKNCFFTFYDTIKRKWKPKGF